MLGEERFSFDEETINAMDMYSDLTVYGDPNDNLTDIAKSTFIERQRNMKEGKPIYKNADGDISKTLKGRLASKQSMKGNENYRSASEIQAGALTFEQI
jgi:protein associated with RNAse G/E